MSGSLKVGGSELINDAGGSGALNWGAGIPSVSIVQVQSTQITTSATTTSISANTDTVVSNGTASGTGSGILDVNITPKITGSKIWLQCNWTGEWGAAGNITNHMFFFWRDTTKLGNTEHVSSSSSPGSRQIGISPATLTYRGDEDASSTPEHVFMQYFDTHGISAGTQITYKLGVTAQTGTNLYTNRTVDDTNYDYMERGVSSLVAIELAP